MPGIGDRIGEWVDDRAQEWKDTLGGWFAHWLGAGVQAGGQAISPPLPPRTVPTAAELKHSPNVPQEVLDLLTYYATPGTPGGLLVDLVSVIVGAFQVVGALGQPPANLIGYWQEGRLRTTRLDPRDVMAHWRRTGAPGSPYFADLRDQGWSEDRIKALQLLTEVIPGVQDLIRMSVREAFSPEIAEKFGQYQDPPVNIYPWAEKIGLSQEWVDRYWAAHWDLPSVTQGIEMLRRGVIDDATLDLLLRALDVMPFWRPHLKAISWEVPTRVDVRRFWDMRTVDEARMREIYTSLGYHGKDLEDYVLWTKVYTAFPDLLARYKNGWITLEMVKAELVAMGMSAARAQEMIEEKIKKAAPERVAAEKDLTKADIINGVKKGVITRVQGAELLTDIGYSDDEAVYLLDVNIPTDQETSVKTARELTKADVLKGLKTGVITEADALGMLLNLRYTSTDAQFLLRVYLAAARPPTETALKEASKADIVAAVKKGLITQEAGYLMLLDIGFAPDAAVFILSVATEESPFSPMSYEEFKDRTQSWRRAVGQSSKPVTEQLKEASREVVRLTDDVKRLEAAVKAEEGAIHDITAVAPEVRAHLTQSRLTLQAAQAELARAQARYNTLMAQWRHQA